ncbi:MAG: DnaJ C-terminal domain-containing protein [Polyangia bacterium]|jgi:DnaJ-class molecular chaperone
MAGPKDYYKVLGVAEAAPADEIKKAYRKLAKRFHPDVTGGDKAKENRFKEISEAYETLGDPKKRAIYDESKRNPFAGGFPGGGAPGSYPGGAGGMNVDLDELLRKMGRAGGGGRTRVNVGGQGGGGFADLFEMFGGGAAREPQPRKGEDVVARLEIDLPEAALGGEKAIVVDGKHLKIKIPPGVTDGKTIRLAGQGHPGGRGAPAGDLLIELHERPHPTFRRKGPGSPDIEVEVPVPVEVAILGGKAEVRTLEGPTLSVTIPPGTSSGKKLRLRGKGAHAGSGGARGDLYADVSVQIPQQLPDRARELLEEFARLLKK